VAVVRSQEAVVRMEDRCGEAEDAEEEEGEDEAIPQEMLIGVFGNCISSC